MARIEIDPWEPEETIGKLWHGYASKLDAPGVYEEARVCLNDISPRLAVLYRGLGGDPSLEIKPVAEEVTRHRLSFLRRLGTMGEKLPRASLDGQAVRLPHSLAMFPKSEINAALYVWLIAMASIPFSSIPFSSLPLSGLSFDAVAPESDPLRRDLLYLLKIRQLIEATLVEAPGFAKLYRELSAICLETRKTAQLSGDEAALERVVRHLLGDRTKLDARAAAMLEAIISSDVSTISATFTAPKNYCSFLPVPLWPELGSDDISSPMTVESRETGRAETGSEAANEKKGAKKARRKQSDQIERKDSFILHKFEAILSWAEFVNLNRRVEDDEHDNAKKAAEDQDEIGLGQISKSPATRLKLHLDLAPEDVDREALCGVHVYPEWDAKSATYLKDHVRVLASPVETVTPADEITANWHGGRQNGRLNGRARRRVRAVKRQFEALRPGRISTCGHYDGEQLDMDQTVRSIADFAATGEVNERIWRQTRAEQRDLGVSILLDVSRSTEAAIPGIGHDGRTVIEVEREALIAFAWGLSACGDDFAIHAFSSLKRDRVYVQTAKQFGETMSQQVENRIASLRPGFYTRLGAAIRHVSMELNEQPRKRRLLLVITDGKPNDLDHYEGRHGIEDSRMAVLEARRAGHAVYGITVDRDAKSWFSRIFGTGGFTVIDQPDRLTTALPRIYHHLVGAHA